MTKEDLDETEAACRESLSKFPAHIRAAEAIFWKLSAEVRKEWLEGEQPFPDLTEEWFAPALDPLGYGGLDELDYKILRDDIMTEFKEKDGHTPCLIWDLAHTLQHAIAYRDTQPRH